MAETSRRKTLLQTSGLVSTQRKESHQLPELDCQGLIFDFWLHEAVFLWSVDSFFLSSPLFNFRNHFDVTWPWLFQPVFGHTDAGCCPVAAFPTRAVIRSRPPPPGSAAHRRLEAERRYSSSPRQRRSGTPGIGARARVPHILTRFLQPRPARLLKDLVGKSPRRAKERKRQQASARRAGATILHLCLISHPSNPPSLTSSET